MNEFYCASCGRFKPMAKKSRWNGVVKCMDCINGIIKSIASTRKLIKTHQ